MTNRPFHTQYHRVFLIIISSLSHHNYIIISPNMTNRPFHTQYHRIFLIFRLNLRISATRSLRALCVGFFSKKIDRIENPKSRWGHVESWNVLVCESSTTKRFPEALEKDITTVRLKLETYLRTEWNLEVGGVLLPNTSWWSVGHYRLITLVQRIYLDSVEINFILIMMQ